MTEKQLLDLQEDLDYYKAKCGSLEEGLFRQDREIYKLEKEIEELKNRCSKLQSKYDKSKTDEVNVLVETENTVLLDKTEFEEYVRRHNELKRRNKRRKEKNRKYRNELKKRLNEINGLKDFLQEDLCRDDKVLKGFIEEYL